MLELLDAIHPVFLRQPALIDAELPWERLRLQALQNLNRPEELFIARDSTAGF